MARNELSMKQKVELILQSEGRSQRQLAELFNIGKTQVQTILKRKADILEAYQGNRDTARKRLCVRMEHGYLNLIMCRWLQHVQAQGIPVNGPIIQKAALHFAKELGVKDFKASNGWLRSFRSRNNISFETFCDESPGVNQAWKFQAKLSGQTSYSSMVLPSSSPNAGPTVWVVSGNEAVPVPTSAASTTSAPSNSCNTRMESHSSPKAVSTPASSNCQREPNDYHKNILKRRTPPTSQEAYQITALQELIKQIKQETEALQKEQETVRQKLGAQTFHIALFGQPSPIQPEVASTPSIAKWALTRKETVPVTGNSPTTAAPGASNSALTGQGTVSPNPLVSSRRPPPSNMNPNLLSKPKNQSLKGLKVDAAAQVLSSRAVATTGVSSGQGEIDMTISSGVGRPYMEEHERMGPQEKHKEILEMDIDLSRVKSEAEDHSSTGSVHDDVSLPGGPVQQPFDAEPMVLPFCIKIVKDTTDCDNDSDPQVGSQLQQEQTQLLPKPPPKHSDLQSTPDNRQLEILKTLLKLTTKERDSYKTQNDTLLRRIQGLETQLLELTRKNVKKDLCHKWTQADFELISNTATSDEIC